MGSEGTKPWDDDDAFPPRPAAHDFGFLYKRKLWPCSKEELARTCARSQAPQAELVWVPEREHLIPPYEAPFLRDAIATRARRNKGLLLLIATGKALLWGGLLVGTPSQWPFYLYLFVTSGLLPLRDALRDWRTRGESEGKEKDAKREVERVSAIRYLFWLHRRPRLGVATVLAALLAVGSCEVVSFAENGGRLEVAIESAGLTKQGGWLHEPWRLLTSAMLHANPLHLAFNGLALITLGLQVEALANTALLGLVFFCAVLGGGVASTLLLPATPSIGASGGILGLFGFLMVASFRGLTEGVALRGAFIRALGSIALTGLLSRGMIDNAAHGGGILTGALLGLLLVPKQFTPPLQSSRPLRRLGGLALFGIISSAAGTAFALSGRVVDAGMVAICAMAGGLVAARSTRRAPILMQPEDTTELLLRAARPLATKPSHGRLLLGAAIGLGAAALAAIPILHLGSPWLFVPAWLGLWASATTVLWGGRPVVAFGGGFVVSAILLPILTVLVRGLEAL